ncbi:hypothetical protein CCYA_CCYA12G3226 [Cyanidiococcus yangmingshanensis]|nr:hypothetical protein CCYA_CCYA12G3226 [Cyanidiococcus yangmingshanensis]
MSTGLALSADDAYFRHLDEWVWTEIASTIPTAARYGENAKDLGREGTTERSQVGSEAFLKTKKTAKRRPSAGLVHKEAAILTSASVSDSERMDVTVEPTSSRDAKNENLATGAATRARLASSEHRTSARDEAHGRARVPDAAPLPEKRYTFSRTVEETPPKSAPKRVTTAHVKAARTEEKRAAVEPDETLRARQFEKAITRAAGAKVKDDPRLLQRTLKRQHKERARRAQKWKARLQMQEAADEARRRKRTLSLKARQLKRKEKRILARAKKLARS